jgi:hypothetical protein
MGQQVPQPHDRYMIMKLLDLQGVPYIYDISRIRVKLSEVMKNV